MNMSKKIKSILLSVIFLSGTSLFAQLNKTQQAPTMQQAPQQAPKIKVSDTELENFGHALKSVQEASQDAQQKLVSYIQEEGLTPERYNELRKAEMDPANDVTPTAEEKKAKAKVDDKIAEVGDKIKKQQDGILKENNLTEDRFQAIATALRSDQELMGRFQKMMTAED